MRFVFLLLVFLFGSSAWAAPAKLQQLAVEADDGHTLTLWAREVSRPRAAIVLIHGRTWSALPDFDLQVPGDQRSVMQSLNARGYSVFALDLRGYGKTPRDATGWLTPDRAARDVIATLEWLSKDKKVRQPVLLGWSMGSLVSQLAAQRRPDLISSLILYGYPRDPDNPAPAQDLPAEPARTPNTRQAAASDFISPEMIPRKVVEAYVTAALAADPVRVDWNRPEEFRELDPAKIVTPTLVLQGERDPLTPAAAQARLFTRLGTGDRQWIVLPGGAHAALIEDTHSAFIAAIDSFVSRPRRASVPAAASRDLNRNGQLDPYEDSRLSPEARAADLVKRMTLEEKAGAMMHDTLSGAPTEGYDFQAVERTITTKHVNSFITRLQLPPSGLAEQNNRLQRIAERTRLGIPVTISTDPRNHFQVVLGASSGGTGFAQWPETLGFAAIGDPAIVRRFADTSRQEYRAVGIHMALSPQADLASEPRWPRVTGTFGSRPELVSTLVGAYVEGFQGGRNGVTKDGVATIVKHWLGYGAQPEGFDGHNYYGRFAKLSNETFTQHVAAFQGAFEANVAGVMPAYPILQGVTLKGQALEPVAPGFNKQLLHDLLRGEHKYSGLILSDWAITRDCGETCVAPTASGRQLPPAIATPWGVEHLSREDRFVKGTTAGLDQFGGTGEAEWIVSAVRKGSLTEARLDESVRRIMTLKFQLGLFDDPYVDAAKAASRAGTPEFRKEAEVAQRRAQVILENRDRALPLAPAAASRVWLHGVDPAAAREAGFTVVEKPSEATVAIVRVAAPFETLHPNHFFGAFQHEGRLDFRDGDAGYEAIRRASAVVPTIVAIDLDRPAILTNVRDKAKALIALFGASDQALLDVITGKAKAEGRLPFELPSSMKDVEAQDPAKPDDSARPLYPVGAGGA